MTCAAAEQHEQDMLEELDRMHEECAALHDDAQVDIEKVNMPQQHLWRLLNAMLIESIFT